MAGRAHLLSILPAALILWSLQACAQESVSSRPTVRPDIRVTPAPPQNVGATATAFARKIVPTPTPIGLYIVKPGDTLSKIADTYETTVDELMTANNLSDPNKLEVGQHLTIPQHQPSASATASDLGPSATSYPPSGTAAPPVDTTAAP